MQIHIYIYTCIYIQNESQRHNDKGRAKTSLTKYVPLILFVTFACERELSVRGSWRPNRTAIFWPPLLWPSALCLSRSPGLLNRRPRSSALCWVMAFFTASYQQLLLTPTHQGPEGLFGLAWLSLPHLISNLSPTVPNCLTSVLTELYNSLTPTQSPTRSLEWHVWSSSSGNNCHAVQRSLSSGVSVYECIMGFFTLSHFIS